ncbi:hypothetical protein D9758_016437 [Tetrapyrgos nigripes]|uniref:Inhibitor of growth protein N-terminal histone-binding domain-containing protein n=1 Tax=Tetrapyrgos nigripes TaxID=182062 RepID=A0A8H5C0M8_9AGAR|nr:hypothetical protein D9758_016437 [Tetrapyrgos nigripes]
MSAGLRSRTRKRRHSQAFSDQLDVPQDRDRTEQALEDPEARAQKEREIWDTIREEHYEAVEQLPLHLHRQYALMRELEEQVLGCMHDLMPTLTNYVSKRRHIHAEAFGKRLNGEAEATEEAATTRTTPQPEVLVESSSQSPIGFPVGRVSIPETTRGMLAHIAWLTEETIHASQEKVYLAQAAQDSVDRQIRLIEQAIKEQELAISLGTRPGTQMAPIILPEALAPASRWTRPSSRPILDDSDLEELDFPATHPENDPEPTPPPPPAKRKRVRMKPPQEGPLTITVPPQQKFCFCQQGSSGNMIACDNNRCKYEWTITSSIGIA